MNLSLWMLDKCLTWKLGLLFQGTKLHSFKSVWQEIKVRAQEGVEEAEVEAEVDVVEVIQVKKSQSLTDHVKLQH